MEQPNGLVAVLTSVLGQIVFHNDQTPLAKKNLTIFHAQRPPNVPIKAYLERIVKYSPCTSETYILALIYIDRIIQKRSDFFITSLNVHRLLITSVLVASKYFDDVFYNNAHYSRVGGITGREMNALELEFLRLIDFNLNVSLEVFHCYSTELSKHLPKNSVPALPVESFAHKETSQTPRVPVSVCADVIVADNSFREDIYDKKRRREVDIRVPLKLKQVNCAREQDLVALSKPLFIQDGRGLEYRVEV